MPVWVQYMVLHDLQWYFKTVRRHVSATSGLDEPTRQTFNRLVDEVLTYIDSPSFLRFNVSSVPMEIRLT
ncbi:MAG: hypothetical protein ABWY26_01920 [Microbacterium sp.]